MSLLLLLRSPGIPPVTGTASWAQVPGGQAVYFNGEVVTSGGQVVTFDDQGGWLALTTEEMVAAATFAQVNSWTATASERATSTAAFTQAAATWSATALERLAATASFDQAAASWDASLSELVVASASFDQSASWDAAAAESIPSTATWSQDATWDALGEADNPAVDVTAEASWAQSATWTATLDQATTSTPRPSKRPPRRRPSFGRLEFEIERGRKRVTHPSDASLQPQPISAPSPTVFVASVASFGQGAARWTAQGGLSIRGTASFAQDATWEAEASHEPPWWATAVVLNELDEDLAMLMGV